MNKKDYRVIPNIINKINGGQKILIHGNGRQTRTFCYITDAMIGFLRIILLGRFGEIYNIGNQRNEISMIKLVKIFDKILKKKMTLHVKERLLGMRFILRVMSLTPHTQRHVC